MISPWQWPARHAEILELFRAQVFGRNPVERPAALQFRLESSVPNALGGAATLKRVAIEFSGTYGSGKITLSLYVPNSRAGAAPTFLLISHRDSHRGAVLAEPETQAQLDNDPF